MPGHQLHGEGEQLTELFADLAAAQGELGGVVRRNRTVIVRHKKGGEHSYSYATLDAILGVAIPALASRGMALCQFPKPLEGGGTQLITLITHPKGGIIEIGMPLGKSNDIQDLGKRITYMRRYVIQGLLGLASEEDSDGPRRPQESRRPQGQQEQQDRRQQEQRRPALTQEQAREIEQVRAMLTAKHAELGEERYRAIVGADPANLDEAKAACQRLLEAERDQPDPPPPADEAPAGDALRVLAEARGEGSPPEADQIELVDEAQVEGPPAEPAKEWHDGY